MSNSNHTNYLAHAISHNWRIIPELQEWLSAYYLLKWECGYLRIAIARSNPKLSDKDNHYLYRLGTCYRIIPYKCSLSEILSGFEPDRQMLLSFRSARKGNAVVLITPAH